MLSFREQMAQTNRRLEEGLKQVKVEHERVQTEQDEVIAKQEEDLDKLNKKLVDYYYIRACHIHNLF